ncbi:metal-dependent hydrolase [Phosphitispora fastidiosa]|uniref:metal-dependent hydrolase n=1 Tax=Phosphitispora fastidiosa TaxID=2837202 RepID=UPI001E316FF1|nr:metal-dependent hydrolase [Phosphitispora fastidiosa]MBU7006464.1 inner membrane protein [Phosphitispora fastidiosa]
MDPLTHALVGMGVAALSGDKFALSNPMHLGAMLGALAPDLDIVLQLFGDVPYLTHHRGSSHSIPGVLVISGIITAGLWLLMGGVNPGLIFIWTFLGALSHIALDIFNSYGAKILWPFSRKRYTLNLLVLADPVIIVIFAVVIFWPGMSGLIAEAAFWLAVMYLGSRFYLRQRVHHMLERQFAGDAIFRIVVMPAMVSLWNWSFLIETRDSYIIGEIRCFSPKPGIKKILEKVPLSPLIGKALKSRMGQLFQSFTPYFHISHCLEDGKHIVRFCDLRYFIREDFLHSATVIFDETQTIIDAVFQPYNKNRKIRLPEGF